MTADPTDDEVRESIIDAVGDIPGLRLASEEELAAFLAEGARISAEREAADRAAGKRTLDEATDREVIDRWYTEARQMTLERLPDWLTHLLTTYRHDYGTIVHALAAGAVGTCWAMNEQAGITGFQAGAVMWEFITHWDSLKGSAWMIKADDLLYPQYADRVGSIPDHAWAWMQTEAATNLATKRTEYTHPDVIAWWERLARGDLPDGWTLRDR